MEKLFIVVVNNYQQYSIWPADKDIPNGWKSIGSPSTKQECLEYIDSVWHDLRPVSHDK